MSTLVKLVETGNRLMELLAKSVIGFIMERVDYTARQTDDRFGNEPTGKAIMKPADGTEANKIANR